MLCYVQVTVASLFVKASTPALVNAERAARLAADARDWPSLTLDAAQLADLELLLGGAFGPVPGYPQDRLRDGLRVPALVVPAGEAAGIAPGDSVALRGPAGQLLAVLRVSRVRWPGEAAAAGQAPPPGRAQLAGPDDGIAPADEAVPTGHAQLTGRLEGVRPPSHDDYPGLRLGPDEVRAALAGRGWVTPGRSAPWAVWADGLLHTADIARIRALTRQGKHCVVLAPAGSAALGDRRFDLRVRALHAALDALDEPLRATEATLTRAALAAEATGRSEEPPSAPPAPVDLAHAPVDQAQPAQALLVLVPVSPSAELAAPREPALEATSTRGGAGPGAAAEDPETAAHAAELIALRAHLAEFYGLGGSITGPALGAPGRDRLAALLDAGAPLPAELTPPGVAAELAAAHAEGWLLE
jgi:sulfate adenylyltransferase